MELALVKEAGNRSKEELFDLRAKMIKAIDPLQSNGCDLHLYHLTHVKNTLKKENINNPRNFRSF